MGKLRDLQHIVSYLISQGNILNVVACETQPLTDDRAYDGPWVTDCSQNEMLQCFFGWEPEAVELLKVSQSRYYHEQKLKPLILQSVYRTTNSMGHPPFETATNIHRRQCSSRRRCGKLTI